MVIRLYFMIQEYNNGNCDFPPNDREKLFELVSDLWKLQFANSFNKTVHKSVQRDKWRV